MILAIDPGNIQSAYVLTTDELAIKDKGKVENEALLEKIYKVADFHVEELHAAIEMVACYGMAVGKEVFDTCVMIGRIVQVLDVWIYLIHISLEKMRRLHSATV